MQQYPTVIGSVRDVGSEHLRAEADAVNKPEAHSSCEFDSISSATKGNGSQRPLEAPDQKISVRYLARTQVKLTLYDPFLPCAYCRGLDHLVNVALKCDICGMGGGCRRTSVEGTSAKGFP
jgi:hypothetical protein